MDDGMEAALAEKYEPYLWFSSTEDFRKNRFPFFAVEPVEGDVTSIYYALSYFRDYGDPDLGGLTSHLGDSEFIVINLWENPEGEWVPQDLFLSAHYHAISDSSSRHLFGEFETFEDETGNVHPVVYASEWKHGNYISLEACAAGALGQDRCNRGVLERAGIELWKNIGNQDVQLIDEAEYSGNSEFYWSDIRFCGWQVGSILNSDRNLCTDSSYSSSIMPWLTGAL
jgi:hypothetical protein